MNGQFLIIGSVIVLSLVIVIVILHFVKKVELKHYNNKIKKLFLSDNIISINLAHNYNLRGIYVSNIKKWLETTIQDWTTSYSVYIKEENDFISPVELSIDDIEIIKPYTLSNFTKLEKIYVNADIIESNFYIMPFLQEITLGPKVTSISQMSLFGSESVSNIYVDNNNISFADDDGVLYNKDKTILIKCPTARSNLNILPTTTKLNEYCCEYCYSLTETINIPESVIEIGDLAFDQGPSMPTIILPTNLKVLGYSCFNGCSFETITIPEQITSLNGAFYGCNNLKTIIWNNNIQSIEGMMFAHTLLTEIILPQSLTSIKSDILYGSNITKLTWMCTKPIYIAADSFSKIDLLELNLAFPEDAIEGAPWGAPDTVTINYNYTSA